MLLIPACQSLKNRIFLKSCKKGKDIRARVVLFAMDVIKIIFTK